MANAVVSSGIVLKERLDAMVQLNILKKPGKSQKVRSRSVFAVCCLLRVLRKNICMQQRKGGKLERTWLGPYIIKKLENKSADLRDDKGRQHPKINTDHLKPFTDPTPRIPHRIQPTPHEEPPLKKTLIDTIPSTHSPAPLDLSYHPTACQSPPAPTSLQLASPTQSLATSSTQDPVIPEDDVVRSRK